MCVPSLTPSLATATPREAALVDLPALRARIQDLQVRHDVLLEMVGEREEQLEEATSDLTEVKASYRRQIEQLVSQLQQSQQR